MPAEEVVVDALLGPSLVDATENEPIDLDDVGARDLFVLGERGEAPAAVTAVEAVQGATSMVGRISQRISVHAQLPSFMTLQINGRLS